MQTVFQCVIQLLIVHAKQIPPAFAWSTPPIQPSSLHTISQGRSRAVTQDNAVLLAVPITPQEREKIILPFPCASKQLRNWLTLAQNKSGCLGSTIGCVATSYILLIAAFGGGWRHSLLTCFLVSFHRFEPCFLKKNKKRWSKTKQKQML